ncbi:MAG TPA: hypothetical protein VF669_21830 [Tepidisphaeraceae bacterium]|jgi:hypothetical protein
MLQYLQYIGRFQSFRGRVLQLPGWARLLIGILAIPGVLLLALSILAVLVSILALLLLTVPAYRVLSALLVSSPDSPENNQQPEFVPPNPNRRHIDVKIVE